MEDGILKTNGHGGGAKWVIRQDRREESLQVQKKNLAHALPDCHRRLFVAGFMAITGSLRT